MWPDPFLYYWFHRLRKVHVWARLGNGAVTIRRPRCFPTRCRGGSPGEDRAGRSQAWKRAGGSAHRCAAPSFAGDVGRGFRERPLEEQQVAVMGPVASLLSLTPEILESRARGPPNGDLLWENIMSFGSA